MSEPLLAVDDLTVQYMTEQGTLSAVSDASFEIESGEQFGVVGESGCGKSTVAKAIMGGLDANGRIASGQIRYKGEEIQDFTEEELNERIRWKEISYIPQGSMNSLDPLERLSAQAIEIARTHTDLSKEEALEKFSEMFELVGLPPSRVTDYPHQFSGGMQQRAIIALALFLEPSLIIADEPTTALDVVMQDLVFKYLDRLNQTGQSLILITHDIAVVFESCERMAVMHGGQTAEVALVEEIYDHPRHPYSILLQRAFPNIMEPDRELDVIEGDPPQLWDEVDYCSFIDRCPWAVEECSQSAPELEGVGGSESQHVACFRRDEMNELKENYDAE